MRRLPGIPSALLAAAFLACASASLVAGTIPIDTFTDPLPPNPALPVTGQRVVFSGGQLCDGAACPPGQMVGRPPNSSQAWAYQRNVPGVISRGTRNVEVENGDPWLAGPGPYGLAVTRIESSPPRIQATVQQPMEFGLFCFYGAPIGEDVFHLDFDALGVTAIRFRIDCVGSSCPDLTWECGLSNYDPDVIGHIDRTGTWSNQQTIEIPLRNLLPPESGVRLTNVEWIYVALLMCGHGCVSPALEVQSLAISEFVLVTDQPTPTVSGSWGRLKSLYR